MCLHYNPVQPLSTIDLIIWPLTLDSIHGFSFWQVNTKDPKAHSHSCQNSGKDLDPGHWLTTDTCHIASSLQNAICHTLSDFGHEKLIALARSGSHCYCPYVEMSANQKINLMTFWVKKQSHVRAVWCSKGYKHLRQHVLMNTFW